MKRMRFGSWAAPALAVMLLAGCSAVDDTGATAAAARAEAQSTWKLELDGNDPLPLESMDVYLVDDEEESEEPEVFEIRGADVVLVGTFPIDLHVGYDEAFERLVGRTISLDSNGGDPGGEKQSWVRIGGTPFAVVGGSLVVDKVTGKWSGNQGDRTCRGTIELEVEGPNGTETVRGKFSVNCVTLG